MELINSHGTNVMFLREKELFLFEPRSNMGCSLSGLVEAYTDKFFFKTSSPQTKKLLSVKYNCTFETYKPPIIMSNNPSCLLANQSVLLNVYTYVWQAGKHASFSISEKCVDYQNMRR